MTEPLNKDLPETPAEIELPPQVEPPSWTTVFLGGLFIIALLCVCYAAKTIILPIILAIMLKLFLQPLMRLLSRVGLPRIPSAVLTILLVAGVFYILGALLSGPAANWAEKLPAGLQRAQEKFSEIGDSFTSVQKALHQAEKSSLGAGAKTVTVEVKGTTVTDRILASTALFASGLFETLLVLFFMLISGDTFLRRLVEILPKFRDKKQAVDISQQIERDISAYLATITIMNTLTGLAAFIIMLTCGVEDPILWGAIAFLMNYVPIVGPLLVAGVFAFVGIISLPDGLTALMPAALYLLVHMTESQVVTPMLLARRFTLNPVLVVLSLVFWYWMWGVPGAILATPMLAITKIVCDRLDRFKPLGHFMEG